MKTVLILPVLLVAILFGAELFGMFIIPNPSGESWHKITYQVPATSSEGEISCPGTSNTVPIPFAGPEDDDTGEPGGEIEFPCSTVPGKGIWIEDSVNRGYSNCEVYQESPTVYWVLVDDNTVMTYTYGDWLEQEGYLN